MHMLAYASTHLPRIAVICVMWATHVAARSSNGIDSDELKVPETDNQEPEEPWPPTLLSRLRAVGLSLFLM